LIGDELWFRQVVESVHCPCPSAPSWQFALGP
jgi:hypothetical protein